jgi:hypothetical protein
MFKPLPLLLLACSVGAAHAEERGDLALTIDGETYAYDLWASQSDWSGSPDYGSLSIYAQPVDDASPYGALSLGFSFAGTNADLGELRVSTVADGETTRHYAGEDAEDGALTVTLASSSVSGEELSVAGSFEGRAGPSDNFGRDIDLAAGMDIEGTFDVVLAPYE